MQRFRFGIRTTLLSVAIAALAFFALREYFHNLERERLRETRVGFMRWVDRTNRADGKIHTYFGLSEILDPRKTLGLVNDRIFIVSNTLMTYDSDRSPELIFKRPPEPPDPKRFYLIPSQKWVNGAEDVLTEWDSWRRTEAERLEQP